VRGSPPSLLVDADDHLLLPLHGLLELEGGLLDLALREARSMAATIPPIASILRKVLECLCLESFVSFSMKYEPASGSTVLTTPSRGRSPAGAQRDRRGLLGRQRQRLVERVRVQRLGAARTPASAWIAVRTRCLRLLVPSG